MFDEKEGLEQQPSAPGPQELFQEETQVSEAQPEEEHSFLSKKVIFIALGIIFSLIIVALGVQVGFNVFQKKSETPSQKNSNVTPQPPVQQNAPKTNDQKQQTEEPQQPSGQQQAPIVISQSKDTDKDGLLDSEEETLGTSKDNKDSDTDGLTDRAEVRVYETNPLNPDTDGDTYLDGEEVKNNFNPKGPGKLRVIQP